MMSVEMAHTAVGRTTIECCVRWCATRCAGSDTAEITSVESWTSARPTAGSRYTTTLLLLLLMLLFCEQAFSFSSRRGHSCHRRSGRSWRRSADDEAERATSRERHETDRRSAGSAVVRPPAWADARNAQSTQGRWSLPFSSGFLLIP